jgi:hypothetical protein
VSPEKATFRFRLTANAFRTTVNIFRWHRDFCASTRKT